MEPDARVTFKCTLEELEQLLAQAQQEVPGESRIVYEVNSFPSMREFGFVLASTVFGMVAMGLVNV